MRCKSVLFRFLALLLTVALLNGTIILPAARADMQINLICDKSGSIQLGETLYFDLIGTETVDMMLMVVTPDSHQEYFSGTQVAYMPRMTGLHCFIAYGYSGTSTQGSASPYCYSPFIYIDVLDSAAQPTTPPDMPEISIAGYVDGAWQDLNGLTVRDGAVPLSISLSGNVPADASLSVAFMAYSHTHTLIDQQTNGQMVFQTNTRDGEEALIPDYNGLSQVTVRAVLTLPGGISQTEESSFVLDTFTNEMRYVNQFIDLNNHQAYNTEMGQRLYKWLDMTQRADGPSRDNSGYLMLEQEMEYEDGAGNWLLKTFAEGGTVSIEVLGSFGLSAVMSAAGDIAYKDKFGSAGKDALPYYQNLAGVYTAYISDLLQRMEIIYAGTAIEESFAENLYVLLMNKVPEEASEINSNDALDTIAFFGNVKDSLELLDQPSNSIVFALRLGDDHIVLKSPWTSTVNKASYTFKSWQDKATKPDRHEFLFVRSDAPGKKCNIDHLFSEVAKGKTLDITFEKNPSPALNCDSDKFLSILKTASERKEYRMDWQEGDLSPRVDITTASGLNIGFINEYGLQDYLSKDEKRLYNRYCKEKSAKKPPDTSISRSEWVGLGFDIAAVVFDGIAWVSSYQYQSALQRAYFAAFMQVTDEYLQMLMDWDRSLDALTPKQARQQHAEEQRAAIRAMAYDIALTRNESLAKARQGANAWLFSADQFLSWVEDAIVLADDIVLMPPSTKEAIISFWKEVVKKKDLVQAGNLNQLLKTASATGALLSFGAMISRALISGKMDFQDDVQSTYAMKWTLFERIDGLMESYAQFPTHQLAFEIIEQLELMRQFKLHGEELIRMYYLDDLLDDLDIEGDQTMQALLFNEMLGRTWDEALDIDQHLTRVWAIYENVRLGTVAELKDKGIKFTELGLFESEKKSAAVGCEIIGLYARGNTEALYREQPLQTLPAAYAALPTDRMQALGSFSEYALAKVAATERQGWQQAGVVPATHDMYRQDRYLYSSQGLEMLLTEEQVRTYWQVQDEVNRILSANIIRNGEQTSSVIDRDEQQYAFRLDWLRLTQKYIDSLDMYDPMITYP